ncbi:hypothetical protein K439DRAFT_1625126 [Ramaria rubella]|nr:hypothetical protein K439DRAFT_1625126 [Ramaria rubella]
MSFDHIWAGKNASKRLHILSLFDLEKVVQKGNIFGPFFPLPTKQAAQTATKQATQTAAKQAAQTAVQSPVSESLMLTLGHVDATTRSNATGHTAVLPVDHACTHNRPNPPWTVGCLLFTLLATLTPVGSQS